MQTTCIWGTNIISFVRLIQAQTNRKMKKKSRRVIALIILVAFLAAEVVSSLHFHVHHSEIINITGNTNENTATNFHSDGKCFIQQYSNTLKTNFDSAEPKLYLIKLPEMICTTVVVAEYTLRETDQSRAPPVV